MTRIFGEFNIVV